MVRPLLPRAIGAALAGALLLAVSACGPTGAQSERIEPTAQPVYPQVITYPNIPVIEDIPYGSADGQPLLLDACFPDDASIDDPGSPPRPVIVSIHGGSWMRGDKSNINWRSVCQWFASEGFVAVSVNYRLVPASTFPAQLDDVQDAVDWLRDPAQVARYNIDPDNIGAFGGSSGGNLAALLGTSGRGEWTVGARVAVVVDLSGPVDIREPIPTTDSYNQDFPAVQLAYLGCASFDGCITAAGASPITLIDSSDPPFFVAHSVDDFIPLSQSERFVETLRAAGVDTTFISLEGSLHSIAMLDDDMRQRVIAFFREKLGQHAIELAQPENSPEALPEQ
jgi:acetyl esterase